MGPRPTAYDVEEVSRPLLAVDRVHAHGVRDRPAATSQAAAGVDPQPRGCCSVGARETRLRRPVCASTLKPASVLEVALRRVEEAARRARCRSAAQGVPEALEQRARACTGASGPALASKPAIRN